MTHGENVISELTVLRKKIESMLENVDSITLNDVKSLHLPIAVPNQNLIGRLTEYSDKRINDKS